MTVHGRPVRLAVFFDQKISVGGGFQQALNAVLLLRKLPPELCKPILVTTVKENIPILENSGFDCVYFPLRFGRALVLWLRSRIESGALLTLLHRSVGMNYLDRFFFRYGIDLIYFTSPTILASFTERVNYIATIWDLCHRDELEFPEVRRDREFERRETMFRSTLPKAVAILADSELGRSNIVRIYGIDPDRVVVMPFSPAIATRKSDREIEGGFIDVKAKYRIEGDYVYYPAQFWPHKNHIYLLKGLAELERQHDLRIGAVFSGTDMGNMDFVRNASEDLGLGDRVRFIGFVPNEEVTFLYKQSLALVMPTYFGPTNLPPLEAFTLGVPVLCSDLPGLREQVGDAALLMDLADPASMSRHLLSLVRQPELRISLIKKGKARVEGFSDEQRARIFESIIASYKNKMQCWMD